MLEENAKKLSQPRLITLIVTVVLSVVLILVGTIVSLVEDNENAGDQKNNGNGASRVISLNTTYSLEDGSNAFQFTSAGQYYNIVITSGSTYVESVKITQGSKTVYTATSSIELGSVYLSKGEYKIVIEAEFPSGVSNPRFYIAKK